MIKSGTFSMVDRPLSSPTAELDEADNYRSCYTATDLPAHDTHEI